jgi:Holliday junction DNA helicase RuvA
LILKSQLSGSTNSSRRFLDGRWWNRPVVSGVDVEFDRILLQAVQLFLQPIGPVAFLHIEILKITTAPTTPIRKSKRFRPKINKKARDEESDDQRDEKWYGSFNKSGTAHNGYLDNSLLVLSPRLKTDFGSNALATRTFSLYLSRVYEKDFAAQQRAFYYLLPDHSGSVALRPKLHYNWRFTCETMIAFLSGRLLEKHANSVIVDVGGVGYEVSIPLSTFYEIGEPGSDIELRIYTHVREDVIQLYGFKTERERDLYLKLISVQGIGARSGITMLSGMNADEIVTAIRTNDLGRLTAIPGVGRKTAERLVVELRDKVGDLAAAAGATASSAPLPADAVFDDALSALINLGYQKAAAERALKQASTDGTEMTVQKLLRRSLQVLAK